MSLLELRSAGSHRGLSSRWSLAYSSCWAGFSFSTSCFTSPIHPIITYMILSFVHSKRYLVDWNGRRRLLGLRLLDPPKTFAGIACALRPRSAKPTEAQAMPAESVRLQWKSTVPTHNLIDWIFCLISNYEVDSPT